MSLRNVILLSALTVLLGFSLVFAMNYAFKPQEPGQTLPILPKGMEVTQDMAHIIVFAYSSDLGGFIQAPVSVIGPQTPVTMPTILGNGSVIDETIVNETLNGTTTTDLQNPLTFVVVPGMYSVVGTFSATTQNATVNVAEARSYGEAILNFGSSSLPSLGHIIVQGVIWHNGTGSSAPFMEYVQASTTATGPEIVSGTTNTAEWNPTVLTVGPGVYTVSATYGSVTKNATVSVTADHFAEAFFDFTP